MNLRKNLFGLVCLLATSAVFAQIPNQDFSSWTNHQLCEEAVGGYFSTNALTYQAGEICNVTKVEGKNGGFAIRSESVEIDGDTILGAFVNGNVEILGGNGPIPAFKASGGFAYDGALPEDITVDMKWALDFDTVLVAFAFSSWDEEQDSSIMEAIYIYMLNGPSANNAAFVTQDGFIDVPGFALGIDLPHNQPDSVAVIAAFMNQAARPTPGSFFTIDNIQFTGTGVAQIDNAGFEQWEDGNMVEDLDDWNTGRILLDYCDTCDQNITKSTDAVNGNFSVSIETVEGVNPTNIAAAAGNFLGGESTLDTTGIIWIGRYDTLGNRIPTMAFSDRPETIIANYKYATSGNDKGKVHARLTRWNGSERILVGEVDGDLSATTEFTNTGFPINYLDPGSPDSMFIEVTSSDFENMEDVTLGSVLVLDFLAIANDLNADAGDDKGVCDAGATVTLGGDNTANGGIPGYSYSWMPITDLSDATVANPTATVNGDVCYTVTVTDASGATATDEVCVSVSGLSVNAGDDIAFCSNDLQTVTLGGTPLVEGGQAPYNTTWSPDGPEVSPTATTTYTVSVTDATGCSGSDEVTVTVNSVYDFSIAADTDEVCAGSCATLTVNGTGGTEPFTATWTTTGAISNANAAGATACPTATTSYSLEISDANECVTEDEIDITVNEVPTVSITGELQFCEGNTTTLTANGAATYVWNGSTTGATFDVATGGEVTVIGTADNGCTGEATVTVDEKANPIVDLGEDVTVLQNSELELDGGAGFVAYAWSTGESTRRIDVNTSATGTFSYSVTVTNGNDCEGSDEITVIVDEDNAISDFGINAALNIYPNPAIDFVLVDINGFDAHQVSVELMNLTGQVVFTSTFLNNSNNRIRTNDLDAGIYLLNIQDGNRMVTRKIEIQ